jgi:DNA-binding MarR family transcriptional regulator
VAKRRSSEAQTRWLTADELETWKALMLMMTTLPTALGNQLQSASDLSFLEYYVLASLSDQPDRSLRLSELAVLTNSELSRLSHLMRRLERRGLVERASDPTDGRFTKATLTDSGQKHLDTAAPAHVARVRELIFDVLDPEAQRSLRDAATAVVTHLLDGPCEVPAQEA